jgi:hypothetical protein
MSDKQWMQRYVYTKLHEIFFGEFPIILTEWLEILVENTGRYKNTMLRNWTLELVRQMNSVSNPTTRIIDFCLDSILGGYIKEFASRLYPIIQCCRKGIFQRSMQKVHEIIGYMDKYVVL